MRRDEVKIEDVDWAAFQLLRKFHKETDCGVGGPDDHWAECDQLVDALGWRDWETWNALIKTAGGPWVLNVDFAKPQRIY